MLSGDEISIGLKFSNDFTVAFTYNWIEEIRHEDGSVERVEVDKTMAEPTVVYMPDGSESEYAVLDPTNPVIGLSTTLFIDVHAGKVTGTGTEGAISGNIFTGYELNREPLTSLLAGILDVTLSILLEIMEDQDFSLEIELLANLPLRNLRGVEMQLTIRRVDNNHNYNVLRANLHNSNLYVDLTYLNGPRFIVEEVLEVLLGEKEFDDSVLGGLFGGGSSDASGASSAPSNAPGAPSNADGSDTTTPIGIDLGRFFADIGTYGLALYLTETAVNSVLGMFDMADFRIFNELLAEIYLAPKDYSFIFGLGVSATAQYDEIDSEGSATGNTLNSEVLSLGLGLDGLRLNFEAFPSDVLLIPQTSYYIPAHTVNTITLEAAFQVDLSTSDGIINLESLYESILDPNGDLAQTEGVLDSAFGSLFSEDSPLTSVLPQMVMLGEFGDVITIEITGYMYIREGLDGLLDNLQLRVMIYTDNEKFSKENGSYFMAFYYHENDLYADLSKLGLGKISAPEMPNVINFLINGKGANDSEGDTAADADQATAQFAARYPTWAQAMGLNNANEADKLIGIAKILLSNDDGLLITVAFEMIAALLSMLNVDVDLGAYLENVVNPSVSVGMTPDSEYEVGIHLDTATNEYVTYDPVTGEVAVDEEGNPIYKPNDAGLDFVIRILGQSIKAGVENVYTIVTDDGVTSSITPLISAEERAAYTYFAQVAVTAGTNLSLTFDLKDGNLSITDLLEIIFGMLGLDPPEEFNTDIVFSGGDETLVCELNINFAFDLNRLLYSQDPAEIAKAIVLELVVQYTILDNEGVGEGETGAVYHNQKLLRLTMVDDVVYAGLELFDSQLSVSIPNLGLTSLIRSLLEDAFVIPELDDDTSIDGNAPGNAGDGTDTTAAPLNSVRNPIIDMFEDNVTSIGEFLTPIIYLNSQGFALMVTNELLIAAADVLVEIIDAAIGSSEEAVLTPERIEGIVEELLSYASVGLYFDENKDGNMSLQIAITKEPVEETTPDGGAFQSVGYSIILSLLQDSRFVINTDTYNDYYNELTSSADFTSFRNSCLTIDMETGANWRFNVGVDLTLSADLREYILNWSSLFDQEMDADGNYVGAAFYIQALNDMRGDLTVRIKADVLLRDLDKWSVDLLLQLVTLDENGDVIEEYIGLYVVGGLTQIDASAGGNVDFTSEDLKVYLTLGGVANIMLDGEVFQNFLGLNLNAILDDLSGTLGNVGDDLSGTLNGLIQQLGGLLGGLGGSDEETPPEEGGSEAQNAPGDDFSGTVDDEEETSDEAWYLGLLDSVEFTKGIISIVVARTALQTLLQNALEFPFEDSLGVVALDLNNVDNTLTIRLGLDYHEPITVTDTELDDLEYTVAEESVVEGENFMANVRSDDSRFGYSANFMEMRYGAYELTYSNAFYTTSDLASVYGIIPGALTGNVYYFVYRDAAGYENTLFSAIVEHLTKTTYTPVDGSPINVYDVKVMDAGSYVLFRGSDALQNADGLNRNSSLSIAVKLTVDADGNACVVVAAADGISSAPEYLDLGMVEAYNLGESDYLLYNPDEVIEDVRRYEGTFLEGAVLGDVELKPSVAIINEQRIDTSDSYPLDNPGAMEVYYLIYNAADYDDYFVGAGYASLGTLERSRLIVEAIAANFEGKAYTLITYQTEYGTMYEYTYHQSQLTVCIKVAGVYDADGSVYDYRVMLAAASAESKFNVSLSIGNLDIGLDDGNIFQTTPINGELREDPITYFTGNYKTLGDYAWEFELNSEISLDDSVGGLFDMTNLVSTIFSLIGGDNAILAGLSDLRLAIQPVDDIDIRIGFSIGAYIDFADISNTRLQIAVTYNGKTMLSITYIGGYEVDEYGEMTESGTLYADLTGMGLVAVKLPGIQIGGVLKNLIGGLAGGSNVLNLTSGAENASSSGAATEPLNAEAGEIDRVNLGDFGWNDRLLLITLGEAETSIAITGALLYSLIYNLGISSLFGDMMGDTVIEIPMFRNLQIGYSEEEGLAGLFIRLTDEADYEHAFRIGYNFVQSYSDFTTTKESSIDPDEFDEFDPDNSGSIVYEDISTLGKIGLSLALEARIRSKDTEKAPQLVAVETLLQDLLGMSADTINIDPQDSVVVLTVELDAYVDLGDFEATTLALNITFQGDTVIGVYLHEGSVYADLSGLGFFRAQINGIDFIGILNTFLGSFVEEDVGINIGQYLDGILTVPASAADTASGSSPIATSAPSNAPAQNAPVSDLITSTSSPMLKILLTNNELILNPNIAIVQSLVGDSMALPQITDIRLSTNLYNGLNNLNLRVKLDQKGNYVNLAIPEGAFEILIGERAESKQVNVATDSYGGVVGITLGMDSGGNIAAGIDTTSLIQTLIDTIYMVDFTLYLEKRNDYFFLRNLGYGGMNGTLDTGSIGTSYSTGPTYFSPVLKNTSYSEEYKGGWKTPYDSAFVDAGQAFSWVIDLGFISFDVGSLLKTYNPIFFSNAYRRISLQLSKNVANQIDVPIQQLTQVANVTNIEDSSRWEPQGVTAFIRNNVLHLSLYNILVLDVSGMINQIVGWVLKQLIGLIPTIGPAAQVGFDVIWGMVGDYLSDLIADGIGSATGFGNPLRVGQIIESFVSGDAGGLAVYNIYIPSLLAAEDTGEVTEYGSAFGQVTADGTGNPVAGATVTLLGSDNKTVYYTTTTDSDGYYMFVNIKADTYNVNISADGYRSKPEPGFSAPKLTVFSSDSELTWSATNYVMYPLSTTSIPAGNVNIEVFVRNENLNASGYGDNTFTPVSGATVEINAGGWKTLGTTGADGVLKTVVNINLSATSYQIRATYGGATLGTGTLNLNNYWNWTSGPINIGRITITKYGPDEPVGPVTPETGNIAAELLTVNDKYLIDGTATEIFAAYADEASENPSFNEGASTISSVFDQSFDDTLETYGTPFYSEVTDANVFITTYDFATETALENAIEQFSSELIAEKNGGTEEIFNVEEVIYGKYYHAVSYSERIIVDIRAFSYQSVRGVNVYRAVLAVSEAAITPVQGDVEIWLEIKLPNGSPRTIRINSLDDYDADFGSQYVFEATDDALTKAANKQKQLYYQNNARNYLAYDTNPDDNVVENSLVDGHLALSMLPLGYTYTVKVRSTVYENVDFLTTATLTETSNFADIGTLYLTARQEPDWIASRAENSANSLLQGIRIRLGADIYDASSSSPQDYDDAGYTQDGIPLTNYSYMTSVGEGVLNAAIGQATGQATSAIVNAITNAIGGIGGQIVGALANAGLGQLTGLIGSYDSNSQYVDANGKPIFVPWTNYVTGFEKGIEDNSDSVVYIEAWVSSSTINSLFAMIYNLLLDYCGYGQVSVDRRYSAADLCAVPEGTDTSDVQIVNFTGVFDENSDDRIYDYTFASEGEYINANYSTGARLVGSIIGFALPWVLDSFVDVGFINDNSFTLLNLIQMFAYQLDFLMDIFDQATRLLSHLLPFTNGYSMVLEKDLEGSPLQQSAIYSTVWDDPSSVYAYMTNKRQGQIGTGTISMYEYVPLLQGNTFYKDADGNVISAGGSYNSDGDLTGTGVSTVSPGTSYDYTGFDISKYLNQRATDVKTLIDNIGILDEGDILVGYNYTTDAVSYTNSDGEPASFDPVLKYDGKTYNANQGYGVNASFGTTATAPEVNDDGELVSGYSRDIDFVDKSIYAKVVLNNNVDTLLDRIVLFINGASYSAAEMGTMYGYDDYMPNATVLRADTILYKDDGEPLNEKYAATAKMIDEWIDSNIVNSYVIITDYKYETDVNGVQTAKVVGRTYIRDVYGHFDEEDHVYGEVSWLNTGSETDSDGNVTEMTFAYVSRYRLNTDGSPDYDVSAYNPADGVSAAPYASALELMSAKDDQFLEIDINNTGVQLRSVMSLNEGGYFLATPNGTAGLNETAMLPPSEIVFHDPYNLLDFTAIGGTWAGGSGAIRHNLDENGNFIVDSILDILPNRVYANFDDGTSDLSQGVHVYWDLNMVDYTPGNENVGYIRGYCGEQDTVSIKVTVESGVMLSPTDLGFLPDGTTDFVMPEIDPLTFNKTEYLESLPEKLWQDFDLYYTETDGSGKKFVINGVETDHITRRYVFNNLEWDIDEKSIGMNGETAYATLTYYFTALASQVSDIATGESSEAVTIRVPIKVKNLTVSSIERLSSKQHIALAFDGSNLIAALSEYAYEDIGVNLSVDYVNEHGAAVTLDDVNTLIKYASRYGSFTEFNADGYTDAAVYYDLTRDVTYIVYSGVTDSAVANEYLEAYRTEGVNNVVSSATNDYKAYGYIETYEIGADDISAEDGKYVIEINPFEVEDVYRDFSTLKWADVVTLPTVDIDGSTAASGNEIKEWRLDSVNAEALRNVDLTATSHEDYYVYLNFGDALGNIQTVTITVRILPMYIVENDLEDTIPVSERTLTPFETDRKAVTTAMNYNANGTLVLAFYKPGVAVDEVLNASTAITGGVATDDSGWPTDRVKKYGAFTAFGGKMSAINSYESANGDKLYIVINGVERNAVANYFDTLDESGMMSVVTADTLANSASTGTVFAATGTINEFGLPSTITVRYGEPGGEAYSDEVPLTEGVDFVWISEDDPAKLRFDYSSDVESWTYTWIARVGHGANTQDLEVVFTIDSRVPRSVSNIEVYPYSSYYVAGSDEAQQGALLANEQTVNYMNVASGSKAKVYYQIPDSWRGAVDGNTVTIDGKDYMTDIEFVSPAFDGSFYYMTVLLYDDVFGSKEMGNVRVTLRKSTIAALNMPGLQIYPYTADSDINEYLETHIGDITATIYQQNNITIKTDAFEIIGWKYAVEGGFKPSYTFVGDDVPQILVTIGNVGYSAGNRIWQQVVPVTLTADVLPNKQIVSLSDVGEELNLGYTISSENGEITFAIADPYGFEMPSSLEAVFADGTVGAVDVYAFEISDAFYRLNSVAGTITLGSAKNNYQTLNVIFENGMVRENVTDVKYYTDAAAQDEFDFASFSPKAFDEYELPGYAMLEIGGEIEQKVYEVIWQSVSAYTTEGGTVEAVARIGSVYDTYGFILDEVSYTVQPESICPTK